MSNINKNKLKKPAKYDKIPLKIKHNKGGHHMFTGLKKQLELSDTLIDNIVPIGHDLVKLKKIINWEKINKIYSSCYRTNRGAPTKKTDLSLGLILLKHLYNKSDRQIINELHVNNAYMYLCSVSYDEISKYNRQGKKIIDHSTLVKIKARLGHKK